MKMVKVPITSALLIELLKLDKEKYKIHSVSSDLNNPTVTNLFIEGEDLPEVKEGQIIPEALVTVTREDKPNGSVIYTSKIEVLK